MTKICANCGHKKGNHKFYYVAHMEGTYCCCHHKKEDGDICECLDFVELNKGKQNARR